jgi:hypothetical protein
MSSNIKFSIHSIVGKLILEATLAQNFISFYFCSPEICFETRELFLIMLGKTTLEPPLFLTSVVLLQKLG